MSVRDALFAWAAFIVLLFVARCIIVDAAAMF